MQAENKYRSKSIIKKSIVSSGLFRAAGFFKKNIAILRYHSINPDPKNYDDTIGVNIMHSVSIFKKQMEIIDRSYNSVSMNDLCDYFYDGKPLPPKPVVVSFDDGFADNYEYAIPVLNHYNIKAIFYLTVDCFTKHRLPWFVRLRHSFYHTDLPEWESKGNRNSFPLKNIDQRLNAFYRACHECTVLIGDDQDSYIRNIEDKLNVTPLTPNGLMMDWETVKKIKKMGHLIGSHTLSHPNLAYISEDKMMIELRDSKKILENNLNEPIIHFSYPNPALEPNHNELSQKIVRETGYKTAVTSVGGAVNKKSDPLKLNRMWVPGDIDNFKWYLESTFLGRNL